MKVRGATFVKSHLVLVINRVPYVVHKLSAHPGVADVAWRLRKLGRKRKEALEYDVHQKGSYAECTCPDWVYYRHHIDREGCKHIRSLRTTGLLKPLFNLEN